MALGQCTKYDDPNNPGYKRNDYAAFIPPTPRKMPLPNGWKCINAKFADQAFSSQASTAGLDDWGELLTKLKSRNIRGVRK